MPVTRRDRGGILRDMSRRLESGPWWIALAATIAVVGCAPPIPSGGFDAADPASRIYAAVRVAAEFDRTGRRPDRATLEHLVVMLGSADPAARLVASDTLTRVSGVDLGYRPSAPLPERAAATDRWRAWVDALPVGTTDRSTAERPDGTRPTGEASA